MPHVRVCHTGEDKQAHLVENEALPLERCLVAVKEPQPSMAQGPAQEHSENDERHQLTRTPAPTSTCSARSKRSGSRDAATARADTRLSRCGACPHLLVNDALLLSLYVQDDLGAIISRRHQHACFAATKG